MFGLRLKVYLIFECYFNVYVFILMFLNLSVYLYNLLRHPTKQHENAHFFFKTF